MALSLTAEQKNIESIFYANGTYLIPAYQRPYIWEYDQCYQLYRDLTSSFEDAKKDYFIGNVVIAKSSNEGNNRYIVDGQQRLITIWCILRIAALLFPELRILRRLIVQESREDGGVDELIIKSKVFETNDDESLRKLYDCDSETQFLRMKQLYCNKKGEFIEARCDNRIVANAIWLFIWLQNFKQNDAIKCKAFVNYVLDQVYLLPIELTENNSDIANSKALKIFETINNRGVNLADADIFKAKLYNKALALHEGKTFINQWKEFRSVADELKIEVDDVFRYYSRIVRGEQRITSSEGNLREMFIDADYSPLNVKSYSEVMNDLTKIIECLKYVEYKHNDKTELSKWLQVIKAYSNQYPIYVIVTFLFVNGFNREKELIDLIKSIIRFVYYCGSTTTVKYEIYNMIKHICNNEVVDNYFLYREKEQIINYHSRLHKGFALLVYYLQNNDSLSDEYAYDKILTTKDVQMFFFDVFKDEQSAIKFVDSLGNDVIFDKPKKYFNNWRKRTEYYSDSDINLFSNISTEEDIVSLINRRTETAQRVLESFFYAK